jgi:signal transduction histidine kinase
VVPAAGDAAPRPTGDNRRVNHDGGHWRRWTEAGRRAAALPHAPVAACVVLGLAAMAQAVIQNPASRGPGLVPGPSAPGIVLILLAAATTLPLGFLWSQPKSMAAVIGAASLLAVGLAHSFTVPGLLAVLVALYRLGERRAQAQAAVTCACFLAVALAQSRAGPMVLAILLTGAGPLAAWAGYSRRAADEAAARSAERAAIAGSLLEHTARGERARISRELHDVVAHHISMISVQAETARLTTPGMPTAGAQRLSAIGDTARLALTEMRRLLGVLREDTRGIQPEFQPQPGLGQLNELLDEARDASGAGTRLIISGWITGLDPGVELAAFRIIQEALTNSRRHAPGAAVDVELRYAKSELYVRIRDNGPGPAAGADGGHGLLGMRERATAAGGSLRTGPAPGGGFLVEARLPATAEQAVA